ncbi:MAG TPA: DJ-1/PfpI family protein [Sinorhizobium sp.]|nr:DJ-1/PfpI family protein [Sinorhizobium sp.]
MDMKILSFLFPGFTALDLIGPTTIWGMIPGTQFQTVAHKPGPVKIDMGFELIATNSFDTCWPEPDVLFVPGGGSGAFNALQDDAMLDAMARIGGHAKWVTSVCTGSLLLGAAGLIKGYRSACYWYARPHLATFGAIPDDARVVIDRNRASGGGVTSGIDFALAMVAQWSNVESGKLSELLVEYAPQPPFEVGRPELASPETLSTAESILRQEMPVALIQAAARRRGFIT